MIRHSIFCALFIFLVPCFLFSQIAGTMSYGKYKAGFKVIDTKDKSGNSFRLCIWYPASAEGTMTLSDYVDIPSIGGSSDKPTLRGYLKQTLEFVADRSIPDDKFASALDAPVAASLNATMAKGKWPLIIIDTEPVSLFITNEFLATHGYIVAVPAIQYGPPVDDKTLYTGPTRGLSGLLDFMLQQSYVNNDKIHGLGFGGGAMAAFYLGMQTDNIRSMINIEGGLFMPASKTTLSADYQPEKFKLPLLHIVTPSIISGENTAEYEIIHSPKYRLIHKTQLWHHDFTTYGRIINGLLGLRGPDALIATDAFNELHLLILKFLEKNKIENADLDGSTFFQLN